MTRREAIQQIAVGSAAIALFPACNLEEIPIYSKIAFDRKQWKTLRYFAEALLPVDYEKYPTAEPRTEFMLNILNDCTPKKDLDQFLSGFQTFQKYLKDQKLSKLDKLDDVQLDELFNYLEGRDVAEDLGSFYYQSKKLAKQHFTGCERFMKEEMDYRFIPGKYQGDVDVHTKIP